MVITLLLLVHIICFVSFAGISLLFFTLVSSSYMGVLQERLAQRFGKHPRENLFYNVSVSRLNPWNACLDDSVAGRIKQITMIDSGTKFSYPKLSWFFRAVQVSIGCNIFAHCSFCVDPIHMQRPVKVRNGVKRKGLLFYRRLCMQGVS